MIKEVKIEINANWEYTTETIYIDTKLNDNHILLQATKNFFGKSNKKEFDKQTRNFLKL